MQDNPSDPIAQSPPSDPVVSPPNPPMPTASSESIPPPPPSSAPIPLLSARADDVSPELLPPLPVAEMEAAATAASASVEVPPPLPPVAAPPPILEEIPIAPPAEAPPPPSRPARSAPEFETIPVVRTTVDAAPPPPTEADSAPPVPLPRVSVTSTAPGAAGSHALPFWQRRWVQNGLPWATSVGFHLFILALALILVPPLAHALKDANREEVIVPDATLANDGDIGGMPNPGLGNDPSRSAAQENNADADSKGWAERKSHDLAQTLKVSAADVALAPGQEKNTDKDVVLSPFGSAGDETANFGPRGGGMGSGPRSKLFGHGGNVRSLVYVCDASGSMVGRGDDALKTELKRDIANLSPLQQFNVLIFHQMKDGAQYQRLADHLLMATPSAKAAAFDFVDRLPFSDVNNPIPALEEAFREQPQLVIFLSHGDFNNRYNTTTSAEVLAKIDQLNASKRVHVNTRLLLGDKSTEVEDRKDFEAVMNQIARENGGEYKKVYSDEL